MRSGPRDRDDAPTGQRSSKPRPLERFKRSAAAPGEVHLLGGQWKRSRLPVADAPGLRPTPVRIRQTLYDWLSHWWALQCGQPPGEGLDGCRVIDAFAGSGALGLEAASRGAGPVLMVELDAGLVRRLAETVARLKAEKVTLRRGDGIAVLRSLPRASVDLVLLDPPFGSPLLLPALQAARLALAPGGRIHLETGDALDDASLQGMGLRCVRERSAGAVHAQLLAALDDGRSPDAEQAAASSPPSGEQR